MDQPTPVYRRRQVSQLTELQPDTPEWTVFEALIDTPKGFDARLRARGFEKSATNLWWREDEHLIVRVCLHALIQVDEVVRRNGRALESGRGWHGFVFFDRVDVWFKATRPHWTGIMGDNPTPALLPDRRGGWEMSNGDLRFGSIVAAEDLFRTDPPVVPDTAPILPWWMQALQRLHLLHLLPPSMTRREARSLADMTPHFPRVRPDWFGHSLLSNTRSIWLLDWLALEEKYGRFADALAWRCRVDDAAAVLRWGWETYGASWLDRIERDGLRFLADRCWSLDPTGFYESGLLISDRQAWDRYKTQRDPFACAVDEDATDETVSPRAVHLRMCSLFDLLGLTERRDQLLHAILEAPPVTTEMVFDVLHEEEVDMRIKAGEVVLTPEQSWERNRSRVDAILQREEEALGWANRFAQQLSRRDGG